MSAGRSIRQIVYTNLIWAATYAGFIIYMAVFPFLVTIPLPVFLLLSAAVHIAYISCFLLIKNNFPETGKHWLIVTTFLLVAVFDHITQKQTLTFLPLFAFMPTAMNIFSQSKNRAIISIYVLFPLIYTLITRLTYYTYPVFITLDQQSVLQLLSVNIILSFILFFLFAAYMIFNNVAKHKKLTLQSISLQATLDNSATAIWSIDNNYTLTTVNSKYIESINNEFGIDDLKVGVNIKNHLLWNKFPAKFKEQYFSVLGGEYLLHEFEFNEKCFEIKGVPIFDMNGKIQGATFVSRDITASKKAEAILIEAKKTAEEISNAKARFLSNMSHELRTPLNGIIGITRIMHDEKHLPEQSTNLVTLQDLSEHTLQIVNNILDFAKIEAGRATLESKRFNLHRFIEKISSIFAGTAQLKGIKLITETEGDTDVYVKGDEVRLSQVLINLIGNAFKFTEQGSVNLTSKITDDAVADFYHIHFTVKDTGIGIKKENIHKIFESFSQADSHTTRRFEGTGLGLSIADKILGLMGSSLMVKSEPNQGSTFWFEVSMAKSSFVIPAVNELPAQNTDQLSRVNILLAEDNKVNQIVASRMLQKWKTQVTIASNGREAVDFVHLDKFDVILMDLDMPVMDGYESVAIIKNSFPEIPVIALTAASFDDMNNYLYNKGFSEVVQKPFVPEDLYNKIVSVLKRA